MADSGRASVPSIAQLVRQKLDTGLTLRQLEERSGGSVPYQTFGKISKGEVKGWPKSREVIEGTASALGVDAREVVLSYATQFQIDVSENRSLLAAMLPPTVAALTTAQAEAIAGLIRVFAESRVDPNSAEAPSIDVSSFNTAERRQVTDLLLEVADRARVAAEEGHAAMAQVLAFLERTLTSAIHEAEPDG